MSAGKTERYVLTTPAGEYVLPGTMMPDRLTPTERPPSLVRGYGYLEQYERGDPYAAPSAITLTGPVELGSEDELALYLRELRGAIRAATALTRNDRPPVPLRPSGRLVAVPDGDDSNRARLTITLIPARVPDETAGIYDW